MFANIRIFVFALVATFLLLIAFSITSNAVENATSPAAVPWKNFFARHANAVVGTLFFLLAFPIVPVALRTFVWMQRKVSHGNLPMVTFIQRNECTITYIVWGIIVIFIAIMLPQILKDMRSDG